ncbi:hypothetical protein ASPWEDRAFT_167930 [Aspergillus wentii DTO 134E9]|uniref:Malonyl-CoA:ACP transacylase (MAT) domain-containing protein n=1 Tax=Aspergillus wentii DTO 134E9 TaxID=1073089 RepID=A0A1L9S454_ASPWE|nr:uncharacterized protein ASPWEDRAFT_167930 [Aspergillus wentii DTO 134E9]OJJ41940.1 hypothetical protein ASPWEDRAFT_167930 [Aspergillus wentii DTO 134E9]
MAMNIQQASLANQGKETPRLFVLSAVDKKSLRKTASQLQDYLLPQNDKRLMDDLAFTLAKTPKLSCNSYLLARSLDELENRLSDQNIFNTTIKQSLRIGFIFTGSGAQYRHMGQQLLIYSAFKESLDEAAKYMQSLGSLWSLTDELFHNPNSDIHNPAISQPASVAIQIALVELLATWNILPSYVVGHSSGEIAAAYCAGRISREAAWKIAFCRGYVSVKRKSLGETMMAVGLEEEKLQYYLDAVRSQYTGEIVLACLNSPYNCTVSGDKVMVDALKYFLDADGIFARKINVQNAYHSSKHMKPIADEYLRLIDPLPSGRFFVSNPEVEMFSTVTAGKIASPSLPPSYWVDNVINPVRFIDGVRAMLSGPSIDVIEIGPHAAMRSAVNETAGSPISYSSLLDRKDSTVETALKTVGNLATKSASVGLYEINHSHQKYNPQFLTDLFPHLAGADIVEKQSKTYCREHLRNKWKPDVNMLTNSSFHSLMPAQAPRIQPQNLHQMQLASVLLITDALGQLRDRPARIFKGHLQRYYEWMKLVAGDLVTDSLALVPLEQWSLFTGEQKAKDRLYQAVRKTPQGRLLVRMGTNIPAILHAEVSPRYLMCEKDNLMKLYCDTLSGLGDIPASLASYFSIMREGCADLRVLQVGGATGGFTKRCLQSLCPQFEKPTVAEYTFTDVSNAEFSQIKDNLEEWQDLLSFQELDIQEDPVVQGIAPGSYNMVIAADTLHTAADLQKALQHTRSLLKPGGKLVVQEGIRQDLLWTPLTFGQFPEWWNAIEPVRRWCPFITVPQWDTLLRQCGFSGVDIEMPSSQDWTVNAESVMVSTAVAASSWQEKVVILCQDNHTGSEISELQSALLQNPHIGTCLVMQLDDVDERDLASSVCISFLDLPEGALINSSEQYNDIRHVLSTCRRLLWVTDPAGSTEVIQTARSSRGTDSNLVTLTAEFGPFSTDNLVYSISTICQFQFMNERSDVANADYLQRGGVIYRR